MSRNAGPGDPGQAPAELQKDFPKNTNTAWRVKLRTVGGWNGAVIYLLSNPEATGSSTDALSIPR
jgi:hypothetical protein